MKTPGQLLYGLFAGLMITSGILALTGAGDTGVYPRTVDALESRYADEITANRKYSTYADKALQENYPNISHLFTALAASEAVHAQNFARLLSELGIETDKLIATESAVDSTRENIAHATAVEAAEIDHEYPKILETIAPEKHDDAITIITYAWKAEQQHRDLMLRIKKAAGRYFGLLASHIEGEQARYYVCRICGSTLTELPERQCPICGHDVKEYEEVTPSEGVVKAWEAAKEKEDE